MKLHRFSTFIVLFLLLLTSCAQIKPYRTEPSTQRVPQENQTIKATHVLEKIDENVLIGYVEYNEYGNLFNRIQMYDVLHQIEALKDPIVIVYTHGWHHNAGVKDENVISFKESLSQIQKTETKGKNRPVVGVYVGWRGESIDKKIVKPISLLTFWDRKSTAHNVGNGGVQELFVRLHNYRNKVGNEDSRLAFVGHSLGGLITYSALSQHFLEKVTNNQPSDHLQPFADSVVLINPAIEAIRFKSLFEIAWSNNKYKKKTRPMLLIVTSQADWVTKIAFKIGRNVSTLTNKYVTSEDRFLNTTAIGHYDPFITHTLVAIEEKINFKGCSENILNIFSLYSDEKSFCFKNLNNAVLDNPTPTILTRCDLPEDCQDLNPKFVIPKGDVSQGLVPYNLPFLNVHTSEKVMNDHSDIWNSTMQLFLIKFLIAGLNGEIPTK